MKEDVISVVIHTMCTLPDTPDNIHYRMASFIRGCLIYRVFRGAEWADKLISPWNN